MDIDRGILNLWDMVAIAKRRDYALYRRVLLASASQPPIFPPVCIDGAYHMDGGVREQIFVPRVLQALARGAKGGSGPAPVIEAYFLVNGVLPSDEVCVQPGILDIGLRSVDLLSTEARVGNLWKSWSILRREADGGTPAFHLASIPPADAIHGKSSMDLDRGDMRALYDRGRTAASGPSMPWVVDPNLIPDEFIEVDGR